METLDSHTRHSCRLHFLNMLELLDCFAVFPAPTSRRTSVSHSSVPETASVLGRHWESDHLWSFCTAGWYSLPAPPVLVLTLTTFTLWSRWYNIYFFSPALSSSFLTSSWYWQWYWYWYYASQVHMWRVNFPEPKQSTRQRTGQSLFGDNLPIQRWQQVERFWTWVCWDLLLFVSVGETSLSAAARDRINGGKKTVKQLSTPHDQKSTSLGCLMCYHDMNTRERLFGERTCIIKVDVSVALA